MDDLDTLRVLPNPYCYIDHKGRPAGACSCDAAEHVQPGDRRWVGARLSQATKVLLAPKAEEGDKRSPVTDVVFEFDTDPVTIPHTKHYVDRLRAGSLFAADADTATKAGLKFSDPGKALQAARDGAIAEWKRNYGTIPAFALPKAEATAPSAPKGDK